MTATVIVIITAITILVITVLSIGCPPLVRRDGEV
jgi:hypothetical protein